MTSNFNDSHFQRLFKLRTSFLWLLTSFISLLTIASNLIIYIFSSSFWNRWKGNFEKVKYTYQHNTIYKLCDSGFPQLQFLETVDKGTRFITLSVCVRKSLHWPIFSKICLRELSTLSIVYNTVYTWYNVWNASTIRRSSWTFWLCKRRSDVFGSLLIKDVLVTSRQILIS